MEFMIYGLAFGICDLWSMILSLRVFGSEEPEGHVRHVLCEVAHAE